MKKAFSILLFLSFFQLTNAQVFSDNFEVYLNGSFVAESTSWWTTFSGIEGEIEDVKVVNDSSFSGSQSIYLASFSQGPQNLILPFSDTLNQGRFRFELMIMTELGSDASFSILSGDSSSQPEAFRCELHQTGELIIRNESNIILIDSFPPNQWFRIGFDAILHLDQWALFVDSNLSSTFQIGSQSISSLQILPQVFPGSGALSSNYWIDNVLYDWEFIQLPPLDLSIEGIYGMQNIINKKRRPIISLKNIGDSTIQSFEIEVYYNEDTLFQKVSGLGLETFQKIDIRLDSAFRLAEGPLNIKAKLLKVNGADSDGNSSNNFNSLEITPYIPGAGKRVLIESSAGTSCGLCPRTEVMLAYMTEEYPEYIVGVSVHHDDTMTIPSYSEGINPFINEHPKTLVDRTTAINPLKMEEEFFKRIEESPSALLCPSVIYSPPSNLLRIRLQVAVHDTINSDWKVATLIVQDSISGSSQAFDQANAFATGLYGELTGVGIEWHNESNPVFANKMFYNHVGQEILPSFDGKELSFPLGALPNDTINFRSTIEINPSWDLDNLKIGGVIFDENGLANNSILISFQDALNIDCAFGPVNVKPTLLDGHQEIVLYPNPSSQTLFILFSNPTTKPSQDIVFDLLGKEIPEKNHFLEIGATKSSMNIADLKSGMYLLQVKSNGRVATMKFLKD